MTLWKKIVIGYFILLLSAFVMAAFLHGYGVREVRPGTFETMITFFSIAVIPVVVAAIRTTDFFRDDPNDVARLKKTHAEEIQRIRSENLQAMLDYDKTKSAEIAGLTDEKEKWRQKAQNPFGPLKPPGNPVGR